MSERGAPGGGGPRDHRGSLSGPVFGELLDELRGLETYLIDHPDAPRDEQYRCEAYKWIFSILQVGLECHVWADPGAPRFVDIVGPTRKWGGDNLDAYYQHAAIDPDRRYRVRGERGDAVYLSLTVYGGPRDGRYSERIVGSLNDRDLAIGDDGRFEFWMGPEPGDGPGIILEPDAVVAITRDYLADPGRHRRTRWSIECLDPAPPWRERDEELALGLRAALTWVRDQAAIVPIPLGAANHVEDPYPVPTETFGWAAGDAAYAMGGFRLAPGERLVLRGRSPECAFWNLCLWNPLLHTYNGDHDRVTINGTEVRAEEDGSWEIVVAAEDPGHPNWVATQGHPEGKLWFRWFLPASTPERIEAEVLGP